MHVIENTYFTGSLKKKKKTTRTAKQDFEQHWDLFDRIFSFFWRGGICHLSRSDRIETIININIFARIFGIINTTFLFS